MADEIKKKRGRPPLSPEKKTERIIAKNQSTNAYHKKTGYAAQKKYKASHPEVYCAYEPKIRMPVDKKDVVTQLTAQTGLTITQLFVTAVEEKYGVILHKPLDKTDKE